MEEPLVSVIIPCYNYGHYLAEAIASLKKQTLTSWECIIVNDGSTDVTESVVLQEAANDLRIVYVFQENQGVSAARNTGLGYAKGKYIQFLDADDYIHPEKLFTQLTFLEKNETVALVYGDVYTFLDTEGGERIIDRFNYATKQVTGRIEMLRELVKDSVFLINTPLVRKEYIQEVGAFDLELSWHEDWNMWSKMTLLGAIFVYQGGEATSSYVRAHAGSLTGNRKRMWQSKNLARTKIRSFISGLEADQAIKDYVTKSNCLNRVELYRYEFLYGNILKGFYDMVRAVGCSGKIYYHTYDGLYWLKERLKV